MTKKKILLEVDANVSEITALKKSILETKQALVLYKKETKAGKHTQDELNNKIIIAQHETKEYNTRLKYLTKEQKLNETIAYSQAGSQRQLQALFDKGQIKLQGMSKYTRENTVQGRNLVKSQAALNKQLKKNDATVGIHNRNVGNYTNSIKEALMANTPFGRQISMITGLLAKNTAGTEAQAGANKTAAVSTSGLSKALKFLKIALISTGIGAFVVLLGSLVAYFKSSEEGTRDLMKILSPFKILIGNIKDLFIHLGEAIINAFRSPGKSIEALKTKFIQFKNFFKNTLIKSISGEIDVFVGGFKLMVAEIVLGYQKAKGLFSDNDEDIKKARANVENAQQKIINGNKKIDEANTTLKNGIIDTFNKGKKAITDYIAEQKREIKVGNDLENRKYALIKRRRALEVENAKIDRDIAKVRVIANDKEHKTAKERFEASKKWADLINKKEQNKIEIRKEDLAIQIETNKLATSGAKDLQAVADKQKAVYAAEQEAGTSKIRMQMKLNEAERALNKEKKIGLEVDRLKILYGEQVTKENYKQYQKQEQDAIKHTEFLKNRLDKENQQIEEAGLTKLEILQKQEDAELEGVIKGSEDEKLILAYYNNEKKKLYDKDVKAKKDAEEKKAKIKKLQAKNELMLTAQLMGESANLFKKNTVAYKLLASAQAVISTYLAANKVIETQAKLFPLNFISAAVTIAAGLKNVAEINKVKFSKGTVLQGATHENGGIQLYGKNGQYYGEGEDGEAIINAVSTRMFLPQLSEINMIGGGRPLTNNSGYYAEGGSLAQQQQMYQPVLVVSDVNDINNMQQRIDVLETL